MVKIAGFLNAVGKWAADRPDILAVALVGSHARGQATDRSDVDLILLVDRPRRYLEKTDWLSRFGVVAKQKTEFYGSVTSLRVWYAGGPEVEYGITTREWGADPLDEGTQRVIRDGMKVLYEREPLLSRQ